MNPLDGKAYGSIPHLPDSRLGPGDHHIGASSAKILTETGRTKAGRKFRIVLQEKMDGSCVAIYRASADEVIALGRAGYRADSSPYPHIQDFARWVGQLSTQRWSWESIPIGSRLVGEWLSTTHGTVYESGTPLFLAFDLLTGHHRATTSEVEGVVYKLGLECVPHLCHVTGNGISVEEALEYGSMYTTGPAEGYVWRAESTDKVEMIAKWVNPDHVPRVPGDIWVSTESGSGASRNSTG